MEEFVDTATKTLFESGRYFGALSLNSNHFLTTLSCKPGSTWLHDQKHHLAQCLDALTKKYQKFPEKFILLADGMEIVGMKIVESGLVEGVPNCFEFQLELLEPKQVDGKGDHSKHGEVLEIEIEEEDSRGAEEEEIREEAVWEKRMTRSGPVTRRANVRSTPRRTPTAVPGKYDVPRRRLASGTSSDDVIIDGDDVIMKAKVTPRRRVVVKRPEGGSEGTNRILRSRDYLKKPARLTGGDSEELRSKLPRPCKRPLSDTNTRAKMILEMAQKRNMTDTEKSEFHVIEPASDIFVGASHDAKKAKKTEETKIDLPLSTKAECRNFPADSTSEYEDAQDNRPETPTKVVEKTPKTAGKRCEVDRHVVMQDDLLESAKFESQLTMQENYGNESFASGIFSMIRKLFGR